MVVGFACALVDEFHDKLFIRSLKTEEASASSASMLATPLMWDASRLYTGKFVCMLIVRYGVVTLGFRTFRPALRGGL